MILPDWVVERIAKLPDNYRGQIRVNCNEGVSTVEWDERRYPPDGWRQKQAANGVK